MEPEFITYQKFNDPALADELAEQLEQHGIEYVVNEEEFRFDPSFVLSNATKEFAIKIKADDFEKVNELLKTAETEEVDKIADDYYLFSFTDEELMDVITKADEWSPFDVVLARKLLGERGKSISDEQAKVIHKTRIDELKEPDAPQTLWIIIGYIIALGGLFLPFLICFVGLFIGWHLSSYKKTLPDGERLFAYRESDRKHGRRIFYLSIIVFAVDIIYVVFLSSIFKRPY